jgi:Putative RNA methylase family UPF0020
MKFGTCFPDINAIKVKSVFLTLTQSKWWYNDTQHKSKLCHNLAIILSVFMMSDVAPTNCSLFQPFGKRSGSKADNRVLYPKILTSMARVVRPVTGRAVLLTQDKTSMFKVCCLGKIKSGIFGHRMSPSNPRPWDDSQYFTTVPMPTDKSASKETPKY